MKNIENLIESVKTGNGTNFYILKNIDKTTFLKNGMGLYGWVYKEELSEQIFNYELQKKSLERSLQHSPYKILIQLEIDKIDNAMRELQNTLSMS